MPSQRTGNNKTQSRHQISSASVERIWRSSLGLFQAELSRATFDTWVRDAEPLAFDGQTYIIGVANDYAREWLEDRLLETSSRVLSQVVGQAVAVRFVVGDDAALQLGQAPAVQEHSTDIISLRPDLNDTADSQIEQRLEILHQFRRYWEAIVDPEKVVTVSRYFVKYWLPIIGPSFSSIVLAFKQLRYLRGPAQNEPMEISAQEILQWHPVDYSTFYRNMTKSHPLLSWFIEEAPRIGPEFIKAADGKLRRKLRRYIVYAGVPLSPPHQAAVENLLQELGAGAGIDETLAALEKAIKLSTNELESLLDASFNEYLTNGEASHPLQARTVLDIVRDLLGNGHKDIPIEEFASLAERLENRLVRPDRAILLSWYFVREWQSLLSDAAFWLIILLRSRGFYDRKNSELRDTLWIDGGYAELGNSLGVSSETIAGWLGQNRKKSSTTLSAHMKLFVDEVERTRGRNIVDRRRLSIKLKVEMLDPLTPAGEALLNEMAREDNIDLAKIQSHLNKYPEKYQSGDADYPEFRNSGEGDRPENVNIGGTDYPEKDNVRIEDHPEIPKLGSPKYPEKSPILNDSPITLPLDMTQQIERTLGNTTTKNVVVNQMILPLIYDARASAEQEVVPGNKSSWSLDHLFRNSNVPPRMVRKLRDAQVKPMHFAAWILYAFSKEGVGIERPGIFAASSLLEKPSVIPGEKWLQLAKNGRDFVRQNLKIAMVSLSEDTDPLWHYAMRGTSRERLKELAFALKLELSERYSV